MLNESERAAVLSVRTARHIDVIYVLGGIGLFFANFPIFTAVLRYQTLRKKKEYVALAGLAGADSLVGISSFLAGYRRLMLKLHPDDVVLHTKWQCFFQPHVLTGITSLPLQTMLFLIVTLDRVLAVIFPIKHALTGRKTNAILVLAGYATSVLLLGIQTILLLPYRQDEPSISSYCFTGQTYDTIGYVAHQVVIRLGCASFSVLLYLLVPFSFKRQSATVFQSTGMHRAEVRKYLNRQKRLNTTVGISCLSTTVFYLLPQGSVALWKLLFGRIPFFYSYVWPICCLNSFVNGFIYIVRHRDIRDAVICLFGCKSNQFLYRRLNRTRFNDQLEMSSRKASVVRDNSVRMTSIPKETDTL